MATKKKVRKIKKNKGNKQDIKIDFSTPKSQFANNIIVLQQKEKLYKLNRIERIEEEMEKYDIHLSQDEVIKKYEETYHIDELIQEYQSMFDKQLKELTAFHTLFDEDCLFFYLSKVVNQYRILNDVPDPEYITADLNYLSLLSDEKKPDFLLRQLKLLNRLKDYTNERDINIIFEKTDLDIEWILSDYIGIDMQNCHLDLEKTQEITDEVFTFIDTYHFENPEYLYGDALGLLARHGYNGVKEKFEEGLNKYPNNKLRMYNAILLEINMNSPKNNDAKNMLKLYEEAIHLKPISDDDRDNLELIHENFDNNLPKID